MYAIAHALDGLSWAPAAGVVKLGGALVVLSPVAGADAPEGAVVLAAGEARATLAPEGGLGPDAPDGEAEMVFEVGDELRAGYRGTLDCLG